MRPALRVVVMYALGALLAIALNVASQMGSLLLYDGPLAIVLSMLLGTLIGLVFKYWFDKRWIFAFKADGLRDDGARFIRYSAFGVLTTAIFWCSELSFEWLFGGDVARYVGAVLGLSCGYLLKYLLDRRYVFRRPQEAI